MNANVHLGSPLRKRLSVKQNLVQLEESADDFENELKHRRLEAINKSTELKRRSVAAPLTTGLNATQLAQHCNDCIKLSTENKINSKNAFSLLLIDFMAAMTKKSDSEISKNFQVATCTLDASVKIYGYRVDAVHTDAIKIAGGLVSKELLEVLDGDDADDAEDKPGIKEETKTKVRKKRKKATVVASSSINAKSETEALLDVVPKKTLLSRITEGTQLLTRIPKYNDGCLLMVEADVPCWPFAPNAGHEGPLFTGDCDPDKILAIFKDLPICNGDKICSEATNVVFEQDLPEDDDSQMNVTQSSVFEFDMNASVGDVEDCEDDERAPRLAVPAGGFDSGDEIAAPLAPVRSAPASITDMKRRLSVQNMEYSMFDEKVMKAWAGPTYWKIRPSRMNNTENKENEEACQAGGAKRTRRGRQKEVAELFEVPDEVLEKHLAPAAKASLAKATLCSWKASAVTLAEDYKYQPKDLFTLFHLPLTVASMAKPRVVIDEDDEADDEGRQADDAEEMDYCSSQIVLDDAPPDEVANCSIADVQVWDAANMVAPPVKVEKIAVTGLYRRKHVDMKHLKKCIWDVVSKSDSLSFQKLVTTCKDRLPSGMANSVTVPMLFNALLHLTNERSLVHSQVEKKGDFFISLQLDSR